MQKRKAIFSVASFRNSFAQFVLSLSVLLSCFFSPFVLFWSLIIMKS